MMALVNSIALCAYHIVQGFCNSVLLYQHLLANKTVKLLWKSQKSDKTPGTLDRVYALPPITSTLQIQ